MPRSKQTSDAEYEQFNTRFPSAMLKRIRDAARDEDLNTGQWIRRACSDYLEHHQAAAPAEPEG